MNSVSILANRVHWTRFLRLHNEFNELGLQKNSVSFKTLTTCQQPSQKSAHQSLNTKVQKKKTKFKLSVSPSHSQSPLSRALSQSQSLPVAPSPAPSGTQKLKPSQHTKKKKLSKLQSLPLTLSLLSHEKSSSLSHSQSLPVAPSPCRSVSGTVADCSRRRRSFRRRCCLSLPSVRLRVAHKVRTLSFFWVYW